MSLLLLLGTSVPPRIYWVIGPSAGWTDPSGAEVVAGTLAGGAGPTDFGDEVSPTVTTSPFTFTSDATGLTASTAYKIAFVWFNGANYSNVAVGSFTTSASGGFLAAWAANSNVILTGTA